MGSLLQKLLVSHWDFVNMNRCVNSNAILGCFRKSIGANNINSRYTAAGFSFSFGKFRDNVKSCCSSTALLQNCDEAGQYAKITQYPFLCQFPMHWYTLNLFIFLIVNFVFREIDPGLEEAIASILWATPRLRAEVCQALMNCAKFHKCSVEMY